MIRAIIEIDATGYSGNYKHLNGTSSEKVSRLDLLRAAMTVGAYGPYGVYRSWRSLFMALTKGFYSTLWLDTINGEWTLYHSFSDQDGSEKSHTSYWLGMAFAKLVAERKLGIPWLMYVDRLHKIGILQLKAGTKERGDMVGLDQQADWHVIEAKGRSNSVESGLVAKAKRQASMVTSINGQPPVTTSACIARLFKTPISILLDDPQPGEEFEKAEWVIPTGDFFKAYYAPFINLLKTETSSEIEIGDLKYIVTAREIMGQHIRVGLLNEIYDSPTRAAEITTKLSDKLPLLDTEDSSFGLDGIFLSCGKLDKDAR